MTKIISGVNRSAAGAWLVGAALLFAYACYADLTGPGLRGTQMYYSIGYAIYPLFYGSIGYLLFRFAKLFAAGEDYLAAYDHCIRVGGKELQTNGLTFELRRNIIGLCELSFIRDGHREFGVKAYFLSRPIGEVMADLSALVAPARTSQER